MASVPGNKKFLKRKRIMRKLHVSICIVNQKQAYVRVFKFVRNTISSHFPAHQPYKHEHLCNVDYASSVMIYNCMYGPDDEKTLWFP